jgi:hypothetical protein
MEKSCGVGRVYVIDLEQYLEERDRRETLRLRHTERQCWFCL